MERIPVQVDGHSVTAFSEGAGDDVILVVHGGPGVPCNYVRDAHLRYAEQGYRVVSWDQLGCGESDRPDDDSLWTVERYLEEMETVRSTLGLGRVAVVGNSWGGMLGLEYCLAYPDNVKCFVSSSIAYDFREVQAGFLRCKQNLGDETVRMMARRESESTTEHPEYQAAVTMMLYRHMCRMETWPEPVQKSLTDIGYGPLRRMFGPHLFNCTGTLRWYDRVGDLHRVTAPVLVVASEHDYVLPELCAVSCQYLPDSEYAFFPGCAHMPFWENPEGYHAAVGPFLEKHR